MMPVEEIVTDGTLREIRLHGTAGFPFAYYLDDMDQYEKRVIEWHWHQEFEFVCVQRGPVDCRIGEERLRLAQGAGLFINSGVIHRFEAPGQGLLPNILFSPLFFSGPDSVVYKQDVAPVLSSACQYVLLDGSAPWHTAVLDRLWAVCRQAQEDGPLRELRIQALVCCLWADFLLQARSLFAVPRTDSRALQQSRLQHMLQFIHRHYADKITLEDIAGAANISKSEALRCFHAGVQTTPVRYLIAYRLHRAKALLEADDRPIAQVASEVGFEEAGHFTHAFTKAFGASPRTFRSRR
ncbi:MAG TPA: AraC family transcriptional regulator [Firmicutes bacterium]|nr:AraC family transcriptional regulator [Bacillota bacterium]